MATNEQEVNYSLGRIDTKINAIESHLIRIESLLQKQADTFSSNQSELEARVEVVEKELSTWKIRATTVTALIIGGWGVFQFVLNLLLK